MDFSTCIDSCNHKYNRLQNSPIIPRMSLKSSFCGYILTALSHNQWSVFHYYSFRVFFLRIINKCKYVVCYILRLSPLFSHNAFEIHKSSCMYPQFFPFLLLSSIPLGRCSGVCLSVHLFRIFGLFSDFDSYE